MIKDDVKISIITCTYNSEKYLLDCINSVKNQKYKNFEHIFVDAYSTDGTQKIVRKYMQGEPNGRVKLFFQKPLGISSAMNFGVTKAAGEVVAHLHSDDYYYDNNVLMKVSKIFRNTSTVWCFGNYLVKNESTNNLIQIVTPKYRYKSLQRRNTIPHPATFVRKTIFKEMKGFKNNLRYCMDYDMWLRIGARYEPVQISDNLAVFRNHSNSLSSSNFIKAIREEYSVRKKMKRGIKDILEDMLRMMLFEIKFRI